MIESNDGIVAQELRVSFEFLDIDEGVPLREMRENELARIGFLATFNRFSEGRVVVIDRVLLQVV